MKIIKNNHEIISQQLAKELYDYIKNKPDSLLCLAGGNSPLLTYEYFSEMAKKKKLDISKLKFISLDEWIDVEIENPGSCYYYLNHALFERLGIQKHQIFFFKKDSKSYEKQLLEVNKLILEKGGIDFCILGVGVNGHLGFNEPSEELNVDSHIISLEEQTVERSANYFGDETIYTRGISLGIGQLLKAEVIRIILSGNEKINIYNYLLQKKVSTHIPVSLVHVHRNCTLYTDINYKGEE